MLDVWDKNQKKVLEWIEENPGESMKKCSVDTGLSYLTARKHIKFIRDNVVI